MEIDFFSSSPKRSANKKKNLLKRKKQITAEYLKYGKDYFDNPNLGIGYGSYKYDGRYANVVKNLIEYYHLKPGMRVLEIGCAKGYILIEFHKLGISVVGCDISKYALQNSHPNISKNLILHDLRTNLPFADNIFDLVFGKEVLLHVKEEFLPNVIKECMRVSKTNVFFEIQVARNAKEINYMEQWDPTYNNPKKPDWWLNLFKKLNYNGDWHFKFLFSEEDES